MLVSISSGAELTPACVGAKINSHFAQVCKFCQLNRLIFLYSWAEELSLLYFINCLESLFLEMTNLHYLFI
jgi:hypothetical protein